jgi:hypothetical protein
MSHPVLPLLTTLAHTPHGRLVVHGEVGWVVLQSYARPSQALCELAGNRFLEKEQRLNKEQESLLKEWKYTKRRGGRSMGKIVPISSEEDRMALLQELDTLFPRLYGTSFIDTKSSLYTEILSGLNNQAFRKTMTELSQKRTHDLRLQVYREFLNATLLLAVDTDGHPRVVEELANLPCFAVFTDDKAIRCWDPRGTLWSKSYGFEIIRTLMPLNPGSLMINPRGDISGEFYKNELNTLAQATQRF